MKSPIRLVSTALVCVSLFADAGATVTFDAPGHVAVEGAPVAARGGDPGAAWRLVDWRGRDTGIAGVFGEDGTASLPPLKAGYYGMVAGEGLGGDSKRSTTSLATLAVVTPPSLVTRHSSLFTDEPAAAGSFYGVDSALSWISSSGAFDCPWNGGDTYRTVSDLIALAGVPHTRERLSWSEVEPEPGVLDYGRYMANADLLQKRGILVSGMFHNAPTWAGRIKKLPADLGAVYRFCAGTATAFGDRMGDWEFWNEEDIGFCPEPVWDYAAALKAAYLGFKAGRPGLTVLPGALCQQPDSPYARALFDNDAAKFGDVFNYHTYVAPARYPAMFATLRAFLERYGVGDRAIWMTECGTNLEGHSKKEGVLSGLMAHSPEQELVMAEFYPKSQIALQMEGVARNYFFVFGAYNEANGAKDWGIMRRDGTVKPGYAAMAAMVREVGAARLEGELRVGDGLRAYLFAQPDGSQTVAFWSVSPVDTAADGPVAAEPEYARTLRVAVSGADAPHGVLPPALRAPPLRLVDLCGSVSTVEPGADGALELAATRFPAYVSGLHGLKADVPARPAGKVTPYEPAPEEDLSVIVRVELNMDDFEIANQKTLAVLKGDTGRLRVLVWNMGDSAKTGRIDVSGPVLEGLPETIELGPRGTPPAEFDCVLHYSSTPDGDLKGGQASDVQPEGRFHAAKGGNSNEALVLTGVFEGRRSSRLCMPVRFEKRFLESCEVAPIAWRDPADWTRNDSAQRYRCAWDDAEQALRFDVAWTDLHADRWVYPVYKLKRPQESLDGAVAFRFEIKSAQNKVENDFKTQNLMLLHGDKGRPDAYIPYNAPMGAWETRYVELSGVDSLSDVVSFRLGANPRGTECTLWIRNLEILRRKPAASASGAFWRIDRDGEGRWWAVSPDGEPTFLRGVDHANWNGHYCESLKTNPYRDENERRFGGDQGAWQEETLSRLRAWGFNMLGAGCSKELENRGLAHTAFLAMGTSFCRKGPDYELSHFQGIPGTGFPNVFHPEWERFCDERAASLCAARKNDRDLFGYFFDNELSWRGRTREEAARYFGVIAAAILRHDPNHLLLGCRFAGMGGARFIWEEAGKACDVLTFNHYPWADLDRNVVFLRRNSDQLFAGAAAERHVWSGRPLIITEWSFPALDAGLPCSGGAGQRFRTQAERTAATELMARTLLALPFMVGYDYFMWVDEPALGISAKFPEDSNYGLVNEKGEPYPELTAMFTRLHRDAAALHRTPPPAERPAPEGAEPPRTAGEALAQIGGGAGAVSPTVVGDDGAYTLRTPSGMVLSGRVGGTRMLDSIVWNGIDYGTFTAMMYHGDWQDIDRVTSAEWLADRGALRVAGEMRDGAKAFRVTCDITPLAERGAPGGRALPGGASFLVSVVRVDNIGEAPLAKGGVFLRQYPSWAEDKLSGGFRFASNVWKAPDADVWVRTSDGVWCGAATTSPMVYVFRYWVSLPDKVSHPDAAFRPPDGIVLAPGESYDPQGTMWYVAGHGTGGADGWRRFLDAFPR